MSNINCLLHLPVAMARPISRAEETRLKQSPEELELRSLVQKFAALGFAGKKGTPLADATRKRMKKLRHIIKKLDKAQSKTMADVKKAGILQAKTNNAQKIQAIVRCMLAKNLIPKLRQAKEKKQQQALADQTKAEKKKVKNAKQKARKREANTIQNAKKTAFVSMTPDQKLMSILASDDFRNSCLEGVNASKAFTNEQKAFMQLIYDSGLPLWHKDIAQFTTRFYRILKVCRTDTCSSERFNKIIYIKEPLDGAGCEAIYTFIKKLCLDFKGENIERGKLCMSPSELRNVTLNCLTAIQLCKNLPLPPQRGLCVTPECREGKVELLKWPVICNQGVRLYLERLGALEKGAEEEQALSIEILHKINETIEFTVHNPYKAFVQCISLKFFSPEMAEQRLKIYQTDCIKGEGFINKVLEQVIIPRLIETGGIQGLHREMNEAFYSIDPASKFGKDIKALLDSKIPFHQELLSLSWNKDDPNYSQMTNSITEARAAGIISDWTRIIYLRAIIDGLAKIPGIFEKMKDHKTGKLNKDLLHLVFARKLTAMNEKMFSGVLNKNGMEVLPLKPSAISYGQYLLVINQFYEQAYRNNAYMANNAAAFLIKNSARLVNIGAKMRGLFT
jgi:hypothetical protein